MKNRAHWHTTQVHKSKERDKLQINCIFNSDWVCDILSINVKMLNYIIDLSYGENTLGNDDFMLSLNAINLVKRRHRTTHIVIERPGNVFITYSMTIRQPVTSTRLYTLRYRLAQNQAF